MTKLILLVILSNVYVQTVFIEQGQKCPVDMSKRMIDRREREGEREREKERD